MNATFYVSLQFLVKMLQVKYCISNDTNIPGKMFIIPVLISFFLGPIFAFVGDIFGKRLFLIMGACGLILTANALSLMFQPSVHPCTDENANYNEVYTLILLGLGISLGVSNLFPIINKVVG